MASGNSVIELENLTKYYGDVVGIQDLSLEVNDGEVFGLLGPNGSGKTTTIRLILDFIRPTSGKVSVFGLSPRSDGLAIRQRVGYLPGDFVTYDHMTGGTVTEYFTHLRHAEPVKLECCANGSNWTCRGRSANSQKATNRRSASFRPS